MSSASAESVTAASAAVEDPLVTARNARKMRVKLERTRSSAQRALKGLRFISKSGEATEELWRKVEERFNVLAKDGLLAREDFAPGDDCLSVHIRTVGDWTQELKHLLTKEDDKLPSVNCHAKFGELMQLDQRGQPRLLVDGPYGAPAQDYQNFDVLLLIGLGIGATPFISILRDLLNNTRAMDELVVRTHFARPNWKEVFTKIASKHPFSTVGVFYCGMPVLAKELKKLSLELSHKTTTRFEFHKEYF
ncbi:hypothetical protein JHK86_042739 [Glycine max]|nr:hypothetical protein JHK86_042739 [Glycine max]